jgi:hypothetical protein
MSTSLQRETATRGCQIPEDDWESPLDAGQTQGCIPTTYRRGQITCGALVIFRSLKGVLPPTPEEC